MIIAWVLLVLLDPDCLAVINRAPALRTDGFLASWLNVVKQFAIMAMSRNDRALFTVDRGQDFLFRHVSSAVSSASWRAPVASRPRSVETVCPG
jgi:hypothetical protein